MVNKFSEYDDKILFENFSLEIPNGDFVVVSGESGKSVSKRL